MADEGATTSPDEAFGLVANDTRFGILRALWEATRDGDDEALSFSALHERSDVRDSGQFNYHLEQLTPRFVRGVEDGYELTYAGKGIVGAAVSGVYTEADARTVEPIPAGTCPECGGTIEGSYADGEITVECADCDVVVTELPAPPVLAADYDTDALPTVFSRRLVSDIQAMNRGFCQLCGGRMDRSLDRSFADNVEAGEDHLGVTWTCRACGGETNGVVGVVVLDHPAVVSFLHERGIDLRETRLWDLDWLFEAHATITDEDPLRVEVTVGVDGDELALTLDDDLAVIDYWERDG